jgi:hypothetical protein
MKVSSPIGDLPFKPTKIRVHEGVFHLDGNMGAWPAHVQIELADLCDIAYLIRHVLLGVLGGILAIIAIALLLKK